MSDDQIAFQYMHGDCLYLASALGRYSGLPVGKLNYYPSGALAHAFLIVALNGLNSICLDVAGAKTLRQMIDAYTIDGRKPLLSHDFLPAEDVRQWSAPDAELFSAAGRFRHLHPFIPARHRQRQFA